MKLSEDKERPTTVSRNIPDRGLYFHANAEEDVTIEPDTELCEKWGSAEESWDYLCRSLENPMKGFWGNKETILNRIVRCQFELSNLKLHIDKIDFESRPDVF